MKRFMAVWTALFLAIGPTMARAQSGDAGGYRIGPDDVIQIQVWQRPDLSGQYVVDEQGNLNLPLIGSVRAQDSTAEQLGTELERRFVIMDPGVNQVLVTITGFNSRRFTVVGEVRAPGTYTFRKLPRLWDVILMAGGATPNADMSEVQVVREVGGSGVTETITVDLSEGIEGTPSASIPALEPEDSIVIPSLELNAVVGDQIQVLGSVRTPGLYPLKVAGTVVEAVSVSGGHLDRADLSSVRLARRTPDGTVVYRLDLGKYLEEGYPPADFDLKPGDTVTIPSRGGGANSAFRTVLQFSGLLSAVAGIIIAADRLR